MLIPVKLIYYDSLRQHLSRSPQLAAKYSGSQK